MDMLYRVDEGQIGAQGVLQGELHAKAAQAAHARFGRKVFIRGVVEASNFCRESCHYCGMRRDNRNLDRYRAEADQLAELIIHDRPSSITDLNIQTGEDPRAVTSVVLPLLKALKRHTPLGLSVCLGTLEPDVYQALQEAGATIYIMKFEMADSKRYQQLEAPGSLAERLDHIRLLASQGWHVSSGFIAGLPGQPRKEVLNNIELATTLPLVGCSVSPFIPGDTTPLKGTPSASLEETLNVMALLRLVRPEWVIPAVSALNLASNHDDGMTGYRRGLRTGANLVTMNLTPPRQREDYVIYKKDRFIMTEERILNAMEAERLEPSRQSLAAHYQQQNTHATEASAPIPRVQILDMG